MARTRKRLHHDELPEAREAANARPRRSRKKNEPARLSESLEQIAQERGLTTADGLPHQLLPPTVDDLPKDPPFDAGSHLAAEPVHEGNSFSARHQRRILPPHVKIIHDDVEHGFQMGEDHAHGKMVIGFRSDPGQEIKDKLTERRVMSYDGEPVNFQFDPSKKLWHTDATPDGRERAYQAANEISSKDVRYGFGRAR